MALSYPEVCVIYFSGGGDEKQLGFLLLGPIDSALSIKDHFRLNRTAYIVLKSGRLIALHDQEIFDRVTFTGRVVQLAEPVAYEEWSNHVN